MKKEKFKLEFVFSSCSHPILWGALSTPEGLKDWFAEDVNIYGEDWIFVWNGVEQKAQRISISTMKSVRFRWEEEPHDTFFEFKITEDALTGHVTLIVTDFAEKNDLDDAKMLWQKQINFLIQRLGAR